MRLFKKLIIPKHYHQVPREFLHLNGIRWDLEFSTTTTIISHRSLSHRRKTDVTLSSFRSRQILPPGQGRQRPYRHHREPVLTKMYQEEDHGGHGGDRGLTMGKATWCPKLLRDDKELSKKTVQAVGGPFLPGRLNPTLP